MVSGLKCKSSLFADDVSLWSSHDDIETIAQDMNADLSFDLVMGKEQWHEVWIEEVQGDVVPKEEG